jgi:hypothetical protein
MNPIVNRSRYPLTKYVIEGHRDLPKEYNLTIGDFCIPENKKNKKKEKEVIS